jgi:hypothetical protein
MGGCFGGDTWGFESGRLEWVFGVNQPNGLGCTTFQVKKID